MVLDLPQTNAALFHKLLMGMLAMDDINALQTVYPLLEHLGQPSYPSPAMNSVSPIHAQLPIITTDGDYPFGFAVRANDEQGHAIAYAAHEMRDADAGMQLKSTIILPGATPPPALQEHLNHFAIAFTHWHSALLSGGTTWAGLLL